MSDPRTAALAKILVRYCVDVRKGQTVGLSAGLAAEPLVMAVYEEVLRVGAFPLLQMAPDAVTETFYRLGKPVHFDTLPAYRLALAQCLDATITIKSESNTRALTGLDPARQVRAARTAQPVTELLRKKPWVLTLFPTAAYAQDAEMSLREFEDFVYGAVFADEPDPIAAWRAVRREQAGRVRALAGAQTVRIMGEGTDLTFSIKGRRFVNSDGRRNMPSGEVFTAPVESSAEGVVAFDFPVCHLGREIHGVRLRFRRGMVVEATAEKGEAFLNAMLKTDPGARRLGEFGIGTHRRIQRFIRNILFDEKIGGTIHLALGRSYPECGGRNESAIHWDLIKDLRKDGGVDVDGRPLIRNGAFVR